MTKAPKAVFAGAPLEQALQILEQYKISELPVVVEPSGRPIGLIDVTDLIGIPGCQQRASNDNQVTGASEHSTVPFPHTLSKMPRR